MAQARNLRIEKLRAAEHSRLREQIRHIGEARSLVLQLVEETDSLQVAEKLNFPQVDQTFSGFRKVINTLRSQRSNHTKSIADLTGRINKSRAAMKQLLSQALEWERKEAASRGDILVVNTFLFRLNNATWLEKRRLNAHLGGRELPKSSIELEVLLKSLRGQHEENVRNLELVNQDIEKHETQNRSDSDAISSQQQSWCFSSEAQKYETVVVRCLESLGKVKISDRKPILDELVKLEQHSLERLQLLSNDQLDPDLLKEDDERKFSARLETERLAAERKMAAAKKKAVAENREQQILRDRKSAQSFIDENRDSQRKLDVALRDQNRIETKLATAKKQLKVLETKKEDRVDGLWARNCYSRRFGVEFTSRSVLLSHAYLFPSLQSVIRAIDEKLSQLKELEMAQVAQKRKVDAALRVVNRVQESERLISKPPPRRSQKGQRPSMVVTEWKHAEELAAEFLRWVGYRDARLTGDGADGGVDVVSKDIVAQVKMHNKGVPRYDIQRLVGISSVENKTPVFFAMSYSIDAINWSETHGIALFKFLRTGEVQPLTKGASNLEMRRRSAK